MTIIPRLTFYARDTVRRVAEFAKARKSCISIALEDDSRYVRLDKLSPHKELLESQKLGIFTSPPYVGQIDYHEQHRYAYELFGIERKDELEIGQKAKGKGTRARVDYSKSMIDVLSNMKNYLSVDSPILLVANDKLDLYPEIFQSAGMHIEKRFERPVEDRTERDKQPYSETVFLARLEN